MQIFSKCFPTFRVTFPPLVLMPRLLGCAFPFANQNAQRHTSALTETRLRRDARAINKPSKVHNGWGFTNVVESETRLFAFDR